ncbi:helix-turn-helix domain-containing protein [Weissella viridescens]|uniref:helix-turn-helix domain-containing protein n=1 Tax=Weissella viridescens TaxID=1629 RepID=UPI0022DF8E87|nr:helix-turn-helix transcriptional regulator [Weissella viridescens]
MTTLDRIKQVAKQRGYSLTQVNEKANLGKNTIYSWKTKEPGLNNLKAVADVLGVSVDYLLGNTDEMHPAKKNPEKMDSVDLDKALSEHGVARFQGKELSDDYKRAVLAVLNTLNHDSKE